MSNVKGRLDKCYNQPLMAKRTWQPKKKKRLRKHGFLKRMMSRSGRAILQHRRAKGRQMLTVQKKKK